MSLKEARLKAGMSLYTLGKAVGVSAQAINRYELGQRSPKVEIAKRIADVLGIAWWEIIDNKKVG